MGSAFQNDALEDMVAVGRTGPDAVRLWMRTSAPGPHLVEWWPEDDPQVRRQQAVAVPPDDLRDHTCTVTLAGAAAGLEPLRRYRFRATRADDGRLVGEGRFETAPGGAGEAPGRFAFAVMSCNQPFNAEGVLHDDARDMLAATQRCLEAHDVKYVLMMGDQMYADMPGKLSLFDDAYFAQVAPPGRDRIQDCTTAEVRRLYQRRYRHFWNVPGLKEIFARHPCYLILDDHDIIDNWGSDPSHQTAAWHAVGEGARWAYYDYQGSRVLSDAAELPPSFHYTLGYGPTATFVMDLRSERRAGDDGRLFSDDQERDLRGFLAHHRDRKVLFIVLSVPPLHLPRMLSRTVARLTPDGEDFSDRWSTGAHVRDRDRFLKIIRTHQHRNPAQKIVFLAGDIHVGCLHEIRWTDDEVPLFQFVSSGLTNRASLPLQLGAKWLIRFNRTIATRDGEVKADVRLIDGTEGCGQNPYGKRNMGIVEVDASGAGASGRLRFLLYGHDGDEPVCTYASPWL